MNHWSNINPDVSDFVRCCFIFFLVVGTVTLCIGERCDTGIYF